MESSSEKVETNSTQPEEAIKGIASPFVCDFTQYSSKMIAGHHVGCPWLPRGYEYDADLVDGLHKDIEYFNQYIAPTSTEYSLRVHVVKRVESLIIDLWPSVYVEVTGSSKYGIYLPTSDIILTVQNCKQWNRSLDLTAIKEKIVASGVAEPNSVEVVSYDSNKPVIHLTDSESQFNVKIVICSHISDIIKQTELIKFNINQCPSLSKLILILQLFWQQYDLNSSNVGISTYGLITMCIRFLQSLPTETADKNANLGSSLIAFFDYFGRLFDFRQNCNGNDGRFLPQEEKQRGIDLVYSTKTLCSEDPLIPLSNATRPLYPIEYVKCTFQYAHNQLSSSANSSIDANDCMRSSLLGRIIQIPNEVIEYRKWIRTTFEHTFSNQTKM